MARFNKKDMSRQEKLYPKIYKEEKINNKRKNNNENDIYSSNDIVNKKINTKDSLDDEFS